MSHRYALVGFMMPRPDIEILTIDVLDRRKKLLYSFSIDHKVTVYENQEDDFDDDIFVTDPWEMFPRLSHL